MSATRRLHKIEQQRAERPRGRRARAFILAAIAACGAACGARDRAPDAGQPGAEAPLPAPIVLTIEATREEFVRARWNALLLGQGIITTEAAAPTLPLTDVTETIAALPPLPAPLRLPRVGAPDATGEQRAANERESLRRFLDSAAVLLGATGDTMTLIEIVELPQGARRARYEQRPFVYPLGGGYGRIAVDYTADGRVLNLTSTALPDASAAADALRALSARLTADEARASIGGKTLQVRSTDQAGAPVAFERTLSADAATLQQRVQATQLVVYPVVRANEATDGTQLELRLAWELRVGGEPSGFRVYVDALNGDVLAASIALT